MGERICGWAFMREVKGVSEKSGLIPDRAYIRVTLFTILRIFSVNLKKNIANGIFYTVPIYYWNTIGQFCSTLDHTETS